MFGSFLQKFKGQTKNHKRKASHRRHVVAAGSTGAGGSVGVQDTLLHKHRAALQRCTCAVLVLLQLYSSLSTCMRQSRGLPAYLMLLFQSLLLALPARPSNSVGVNHCWLCLTQRPFPPEHTTRQREEATRGSTGCSRPDHSRAHGPETVQLKCIIFHFPSQRLR